MLSEMGRANTMTRSDHQLLDSLAALETRLPKRRRGSEPSPSKCLSRVSSCHSLPLWPWGRKNFAMDPHWGRSVISNPQALYMTIWYYMNMCINMEVDNPTNPMASASKIVPSGHESQRRVSGRAPLGQSPTFSWQRPGWQGVGGWGTSQNIPNSTKKHRWLRVETSVI